VTDAAATRTAALASITNGTAAGVGGSAGQTFTLTTGSDTTLTGGSGADSYFGVVGTNGLSSNGSTLNPGDNLNGAGGTDTLTISVSGTDTAALTVASVTLGGIEKISVLNYETSATDTTFDTSTWTGVTTLGLGGSSATGDTVFSNVKNVVDAEMAGAADLTINYVTTLLG